MASQEHNILKGEVGNVKRGLRMYDGRWNADRVTWKRALPVVGVGIVWNDRMEVEKEVIESKQLNETWQAGRADTYVIDLRWDDHVR